MLQNHQVKTKMRLSPQGFRQVLKVGNPSGPVDSHLWVAEIKTHTHK